MRNGGQIDIDYDAGPQPGGREPAPGRLALVQAFVNSRYDLELDHGADLLGDPAGLRAWLARRGLLDGRATVTRRDLARALAVREGLHAMVVSNNGGVLDEDAVQRLNETAARAPFGARFELAGPVLVPSARGVDGALAVILAATTEAMLAETWWRLKACQHHDCQWAFFDHSRNAAGNWCSMKVCGGRAKQRAHYRRTRR
ncbi:MAG TPA: CGNR zinc finger domain-containing protein [Thermoleophilaceae bacterium]|jgi:predicted RNA-binding Zn ribbon-like protein